MQVLLITSDRRKWKSLDPFFYNYNSRNPTVWPIADINIAANQLHYLDDIDAVFIGYYLDDGYDTISSGLVKAFVEAGFGKKGKPLIACTNNRNRELMAAGCSHQTDLSERNLRTLLWRLEDEGLLEKSLPCAV